MGKFFITFLAPLTYLHFGGATLIVVEQPPRATISRSVSTQRLGQPYVDQPFQSTDNVFSINSQTLQWPRSARRRGDVTFKRKRPTQAWVPEPHGMLTQWPQGQMAQSEWIPIESIPKSNNPSEWIQRGNVPPPKLIKPEVTSTKQVSYRRRPMEGKPSKTKRRKKYSTKKKRKRKLSDEETLNLMEKYVNKKLALEERRILEAEQTKKAEPVLPSTVTEPSPPEALPPALDFLSGLSSGKKTQNTIIQDPFEDLRNQSDVLQIHSDNPKDSPSLVPLPENTESIDFYSNAFKALTDAFRLAEASAYKDINSTPPSINELQIFAKLPRTNTTESKFLNLDITQDNTSNTDTLINDILSSALPKENFDILGLDSSTGQYMTHDTTTKPEVQPVTRPEVQPITRPEVQYVTRPEVQYVTGPDELIKVDNQSISEMPTYSFEGETTKTSNYTDKTESVTKAMELDISTQRTRVQDKLMAHSLDNIKEVTKIDQPGQIPLPPLAQDLPSESTTEHFPKRERQPFYDIFGGRRQQQEVGSLDLFSSEPPVDSNHPFSKGFKSSRYQQFEVRDNQINVNNDMFHRESSLHHSSNRPTTQTSDHLPYDQRHIQTFDQPTYRERHSDGRYIQPYEIPPQYPDNSHNTFSRRNSKPHHQEVHHIEISIPTSNGWETHSSSIYGIDPSETRQTHYDQPPIEQQGFERRRKPAGYIQQSSGPASSYHSPPTWTQTSWSDPGGTQDRPYVNEFDRYNPDPYAPDYIRRTRPSLSHFEKQQIVRTGQQQDLVSNQGSKYPDAYAEGEGTTPVSTTEDPPTEHVGEFRSNGPNQIDALRSWPQSQSSPSQGAWESYPETPQSTSWAGTETSNNGWERRVSGRTNHWQQSVPTQTSIWTRRSTGYDTQGGYNTQIYEYNEQNGYGQENTEYNNNQVNEYSHNGYNDYTAQEGYNNEAQIIDYTDGEGNEGNDDSDEDDR